MNDVQKTVLNLSSAALFGKAVSVPAGIDWQAVYDEIKGQELVSLLYPLASCCDMPDDVLLQWSSDRDKYLLNNAKVISAHFGIQKLMDEAGIPCIIIKGIASASYYPDYLLRAYGDIDFLVPEYDYSRASDLLIQNGFEFIRSIDKDIKFLQGGLHYELHREIAEFPDAAVKAAAGRYLSDIFESTGTFMHRGLKCSIPSERHHALILIMHTAEHLWSSGIGLRHLSDWAVFVDKMPDTFFENDLRDPLEDLDLWRFCCVLTSLCTEHLGLRRCAWADGSEEDCDMDLIEDLFASGSFGHNYKEASGDWSFRALFSILNKRSRSLFRSASGHPILLPLGWGFLIGRYVFRIIKGERSAAMARTVLRRRKSRQDASAGWHLYEKGDTDS